MSDGMTTPSRGLTEDDLVRLEGWLTAKAIIGGRPPTPWTGNPQKDELTLIAGVRAERTRAEKYLEALKSLRRMFTRRLTASKGRDP